MNSNKPSVIGPFGKRPAEEIILSVPSAQSESLLVNQLLSKLTPVPPSQIPADMMKINPPDFFCDPVMPEEPGHPELLDGSSYLEPLENPSQMLEPKSRNKRKLVKPKPKKSAVKQIQSNKNRSLREEQAENIMKFKENILVSDSGGENMKYQCRLCEVSFGANVVRAHARCACEGGRSGH